MTRLRISPDGRIRGLWDDDVPLGELGIIRVRRASHVEFDDRTQRWTVREAVPGGFYRHWLQRLTDRPSGRVLHQATTRASALAWEHEYFQPGGPGWRKPS